MTDFTEMQRTTLAGYLRRHIQGEVRFDPASRRLYSTDASIYQIEPLGVVIPRTVEDVVTIVQVAGEMHVPLTARGGGTSLSGQAIGPGIILDGSKYLNGILDLDPVARLARVQPGVILDQLNRASLPHSLQFGPDVATANRASLGGMLGNNSAGAHSIVYGKTIDHVRRLHVVLANGARTTLEPLSPSEWRRREAGRSFEAGLHRRVRQLVADNAVEIRRHFPRILRRVSGYNLDVLAEALTGAAGARPVGLHDLVVGGEGTLAVILEAEMNLVPRPQARGLLVLHFASLTAAMEALAPCLEPGPSAVELVDQMLLDLARDNLSLRDAMAAVQGRPAALLMVEFSGAEPAEVAERVQRLGRRLRDLPGLTAAIPALDAALRDPLWNLRNAAVPLLLGLHGDRKPVTFIEDPAVSPERLPEFIARFRDLIHRHGTEGAFYGHASVGCLHVRPLLNLKDPGDVSRMRRIAEAVSDLVLEFGGALSGEHGDGLARSEWNRKLFGPDVYEAFRQVKAAFDPENLLNPGKVVDAPAMTDNLRYGPGYHPAEPATLFDYSRQEGFVRSIELCNGSGACRKLQGGTMCPSFRATRDEKDSTRGRANALRLALTAQMADGKEASGELEQGLTTHHLPLTIHHSPSTLHPEQHELRSRWLYEVLDLCLMCKACKAECPSNVDMAKLKAEFLSFYHARRTRSLGQALMARIDRLNRWGARAAPLVNWLQERRPLRWLLEKLAGIDRRRSLPPIHAELFRRWFARHTPPPSAGRYGRILLLDDCFTTFNEPEIARAAVQVLERAGYSVDLAGLPCCGRPLISKGYLAEARELVQAQAPQLLRRLHPDPFAATTPEHDGMPLLGLEPSCLLTLADEWPDLLPGSETRQIAAAAHLADDWLANQASLRPAGRCDLDLSAWPTKCLVHGHCHQKSLVGMKGTLAALRLVPELDVVALDTGCCGMAGSFGFEKEHYDLSVAIAELDLVPALEADPEAVVVATGTSCRHQIRDLTGRRALHPLQVLAER